MKNFILLTAVIGLFSTSTFASQVSCEQTIRMKLASRVPSESSLMLVVVGKTPKNDGALYEAEIHKPVSKATIFVTVKYGPQGTCSVTNIYNSIVPQQ